MVGLTVLKMDKKKVAKWAIFAMAVVKVKRKAADWDSPLVDAMVMTWEIIPVASLELSMVR